MSDQIVAWLQLRPITDDPEKRRAYAAHPRFAWHAVGPDQSRTACCHRSTQGALAAASEPPVDSKVCKSAEALR